MNQTEICERLISLHAQQAANYLELVIILSAVCILLIIAVGYTAENC